MVAKVISGKTIRGVLNYNENKVSQGLAKCILASKFGAEPNQLSFSSKLNRFQKLIERNSKAKTNTIHISLNFDASEKLDLYKLKHIAMHYMDKIGFGEQPYLVYQHWDAAHPHVHIVTTNVRPDGKRIDIHNIGRNASDQARKKIETMFSLVAAESRKKKEHSPNPPYVQRVVYGKSETKRSISNVVGHVVKNYRYTSLPELNAALRQYNVIADRGIEGTRMFEKKGLVYAVLDDQGEKVGVPIKASSIYGKPTLPSIEKQFKLNGVLRSNHKERIKECIDLVFSGRKFITKAAFVQSLGREGIYVLFRQNEEGRIYGTTFVDNRTKVVFNGSDLGKSYAAASLIERLTKVSVPLPSNRPKNIGLEGDEKHTPTDQGIEKVVTDLLEAKQYDFSSPDAAMRRRKRKKRKGRSR